MSRGLTIGVTGSRGIPAHIARYVESVGEFYARSLPDARFRAGNAPGVDQAFQLGVNLVAPERLTVCLPWPGYEPQAVVEPADWTYEAAVGAAQGTRCAARNCLTFLFICSSFLTGGTL